MQSNNFSHHWCTIMMDGLIKRGVDHFFLAPGSRSSPIVSAVVRNSLAKTTLGIDERSVGFAALGYGKRAQKPGCVIVTSGTAVANLYPAVVEAYLSEVPLIIITADRPYELRDCGANQTIWQNNIFANHINKSFDLAPPLSLVSLNQSMAIFEQAIRSTVGHRKGPVHINVQLREPLAHLFSHESPIDSKKQTLRPTAICENLAPRIGDFDVSGLLDFLSSPKGMIVVGELIPSSVQAKILKLSSMLSWPIFADITSNLRLSHHPNLMSHGELLFLSDLFVQEFDIDRVVKLGQRIVSKRFWSWVEKTHQVKLLSISESPERIDYTGCFEHLHVPDFDGMMTALLNKLIIGGQRDRSQIAHVYGDRVTKIVDDFLEKKLDNEAYYATRLVAQISRPANLFLSSGMPIRDADQFAKPSDVPVDVFANRGASGIDGVISSAIGVAIADEKPVVLLIGDVAFLHDTNGLMLLKEAKAPVLIVVINNSGGGIFHFLPIANEIDVITPYLDTPHEVSIKSLCEAHKINHVLIDSPKDYDKAISHFFATEESMVVEVVIRRDINVGLHKEVYQKISQIRKDCR